MIRLHPGVPGCTVMTGVHCCEHLGGTWRPTAPWNSTICTQLGCPAKTCCGCDWCCDEVASPDCLSKKVYSWENQPIPKTEACIGNTCPSTPPNPVCRREEFAVGKRPLAHQGADSCITSAVNRSGRHELHSLGPVRAVDCAPDSTECRTFYAHAGKGDAQGGRNIGWLCGQYNRRVASTKRANRCYPSKRPDGRHSFNCAYRVPCPEKPAVCL
jgi:hypothetical protein